jgi:hypothetical protein
VLGASQGYIGTSFILQEADVPLLIAPDRREYHVFLLTALPAINCTHIILQLKFSETRFKLLNLPLVGGDKSELVLVIDLPEVLD